MATEAREQAKLENRLAAMEAKLRDAQSKNEEEEGALVANALVDLRSANAELRNASNVDVYGLKVEGSTPILWVRDSHDVNLFGMGGGADAFPTGSAGTYYPPDFVPYAPSILRIERTPKFKLLNLMDAGRGGAGAKDPPRPIGKFPLTPAILGTYDWPAH